MESDGRGDLPADLDDELDALYSGPLDEFVTARNALAGRLRKAGDREAAERVKELPKPPVSAWAVNRLARERAHELAALVAAGDRPRGGPHGAPAGGRKGSSRRHGTSARRSTASSPQRATCSPRPARPPARRCSSACARTSRRSPPT